jgi:hypothetical protein
VRKNNRFRFPDGGLIPGQTGRLTVGHKLTLTLTLDLECTERVFLREFRSGGLPAVVEALGQFKNSGEGEQYFIYIYSVS